jgi:hypothetical protein
MLFDPIQYTYVSQRALADFQRGAESFDGSGFYYPFYVFLPPHFKGTSG